MRMTNRMRMNRSEVLFGILSLWIDLTDFFSEIEAAKRISCCRLLFMQELVFYLVK